MNHENEKCNEEVKGDGFFNQGEKKAKTITGFFGSIFKGAGTSNLEDAADLYTQAANLYKIAKCWNKAATTYEKIANIKNKLDIKHESASAYVDAANAYKKVDINGAVNAYNNAINIYTNTGKFVIAARHHCAIAEIYETELVDIDKSLFHYQKAGDYYRGEESNSSANKCLLKVAQFSAEKGDYKKAVSLYDEIASKMVTSNLLEYAAVEIFFKALVCMMHDNVGKCTEMMHNYGEKSQKFQESRQYKFINDLVVAVDEKNVEDFEEIVNNFDKLSRIDPFILKTLESVKDTIRLNDLC